jgi:hypothetical protein
MGGRVPKMDEYTLEILSEEAIGVYINYLPRLKSLFTCYYHVNFNEGKKVSGVLSDLNRWSSGKN